jgi:hypothetical protein
MQEREERERERERGRIRNRVEPEYVSVGIKAVCNGLGCPEETTKE